MAASGDWKKHGDGGDGSESPRLSLKHHHHHRRHHDHHDAKKPRHKGAAPAEEQGGANDPGGPVSELKSAGHGGVVSKKSMLKFMIHEVRELRKQLDPGGGKMESRYERRGATEERGVEGERDAGKATAAEVTVAEPTAVTATTEPQKTTQTVTEKSHEVRTTGPGEYTVEKSYSKTQTYTVRQLAGGEPGQQGAAPGDGGREGGGGAVWLHPLPEEQQDLLHQLKQ